MCELLIFAIDRTNLDPLYSYRACLKRGDIIAVMPDGHIWGVGELDTDIFVTVSKPGEPIDKYKAGLLDDMSFKNQAGLVAIGTFRHFLFKEEHLKTLRRRQQTYNFTTNRMERKR